MLTSAREDVFQEAARRDTSLERRMSQAGRCGGMGGTVGWGVAETFLLLRLLVFQGSGHVTLVVQMMALSSGEVIPDRRHECWLGSVVTPACCVTGAPPGDAHTQQSTASRFNNKVSAAGSTACRQRRLHALVSTTNMHRTALRL
jgi:hypothetical protein